MNDYPEINEFKRYGGVKGKKCRRWVVPAWYCTRWSGHEGPCALRPKWWNILARLEGFK